MPTEWVALIQGTVFPVVACIAMAIFIKWLITQFNLAREADRKLYTDTRVADREVIMSALQDVNESFKENTQATYELAKAIGVLNVRLEMKDVVKT